MTITFQFTLDDYRKAFRAHFNVGAPLFTRWMMKGFVIGGSLLLLLGAMLLMFGKSPLNVTLTPVFLGAVWLWYGLGGAYMRSAKAQFTKNPALREERRVEASDQGIKTDAGVASSQLTWKAYMRFVETTDFFLLYTSPACFVIMPKRAFQPVQVGEFRNLLKSHIGKDSPALVSTPG